MSDVALGLLAEIERLRKELDYLNNQRRLDNEEAARLYDFARDKGRALERDDVVAWLRQRANAEHPIERGVPSLSPAGRGLLLLHADLIERGEHRIQEEP